ncbi:MAG: citrate synthase [Actinomycetota bacterium]
MTELLDVPPGLDGVVAVTTAVGDVLGEEGRFHYRGHDAAQLARAQTVEAVRHLLLRGDLPAEGSVEEAADRSIPAPILELLPALVDVHRSGGPLDVLRSSISLAGAHLGSTSWLDSGPDQLRADLERLAAMTATLVAASYRLVDGREPVAPDPSRSLAADYLRMLTGHEPSPAAEAAISAYLILTMDHGSNASTFAARVVTSTGADPAAALVGAIGAMSGPLHGGAPSRALDMLDAIATADRAGAWIDEVLARRERLMGFGHRVYRTDDPRAALLREIAIDLGGPLVDLGLAVEEVALDRLARRSPGRPLRTNVEYWAGVVMASVGVPRELFTPTFVVARMHGWSAHIIEQAAGNRLIRPASRYVE